MIGDEEEVEEKKRVSFFKFLLLLLSRFLSLWKKKNPKRKKRTPKRRIQNSTTYRSQRGRADALASALVHHAHAAGRAVGELRVIESDGVGDAFRPGHVVAVGKVLGERAGALGVLSLLVPVEGGLLL